MAIDKLQEKIRKLKNPTVVDFSVELEKLPTYLMEQEHNEILAYDRFCRELMDGLKGIVPAVRFNMGRFSLLGPDGMFLLKKMLEYAKAQDYYVFLDIPECLSMQATELSAKNLFSERSLWQFDGIVVSAYAGSDVLKPYLENLKNSGKDMFVVLRTANKSAAELQDLLTGSRLVHMAAADVAYRFCDPLLGRSGYSQVAGVGPASSADVLKKLRARYRKLFMLVDGYDLSNANAKNCSFAFDSLGHGAVVCSGAGLTCAWIGNSPDGEDYIKLSQEAAERMRKNLTRYVIIL